MTSRTQQPASVCIRRTPIGHGVFAGRAYRPAQAIGRIPGRVIEDPAYDSPYCIELAPGRMMEPFAPFRYLNHSCEPNAEICHPAATSAATGLWLKAVRPISAGEELTIDYRWPAEMAVPCRCESPNCRGWVVDEEELDLVQRN